jgi:dTDP-4-dehydrorhamnose 3,5-epimerase
VLRGVHVHPAHTDFLVVADGTATVGLRDLRRGSPTEGRSLTIEVDGERLKGLTIPRGVAHGFLFHTRSMHIYSVDSYWEPEDELGCHWADPGLEIDWPSAPSSLSARDAGAGSLNELLARLEPFQPIGK